MRILVHYHAYGDVKKVPSLVAEHSSRIRDQINQRELEEIERLEAEYEQHAERLAKINTEVAELKALRSRLKTKAEIAKCDTAIKKLESQGAKPAAKISERDDRIAEARRRAEEDRQAVNNVGTELGALYGDPDELLKHACVVGIAEIEENEFNLNIPRYVDTFDPAPTVEVKDALREMAVAMSSVKEAERLLSKLLKEAGYNA